jgi:thiopeptide-type bacteriocin biosynthesis protein
MEYQHFDKFVLRTPLFSMQELEKITLLSTHDESVDALLKFFKRPEPQEALFLASPELHDKLQSYYKGEKIDPQKKILLTHSLMKYFLRMTSRPTPFGLFASCSVGTISQQNNIVLDLNIKGNRHTRLDMHFLCRLAESLAKEISIRNQLDFFPNPSHYVIGDKIRYVEAFYTGIQRSYKISSVNNSQPLQDILIRASDGAKYHDLIQVIVNDEVGLEDAESFLDEIINCQLIVHELEPSVSGDEFMIQMIAVLSNLLPDTTLHLGGVETVLGELLNTLRQIQHELKTFDENGYSPVEAYGFFSQRLNKIGVPFEQSKLFQTDLMRKSFSCELNSKIVQEVKSCISFLNRISLKVAQNNLDKFATAFAERFEEKEISLLHALDVESGIGYIQPTKPEEKNINWTNLDTILLRKLLKSREKKSEFITLNENDIEGFDGSWDDQQDTIQCMIEILKENEEATVFIKNVGGSSAANLLGRFCHSSEEIQALVHKIVAVEEDLKAEGTVMAEIIHLPQSRTGNILSRPILRSFEIPYLAKSSVSKECQILPEDLMVSVRRGKILLRSKRLNKYVIPRLSNAHNFKSDSLPVYQFLCDLQTKGGRNGVWFSWGNLDGTYQYMPRVYYKKTIISLAKWVLTKKDFKSVVEAKPGKALAEEISKWLVEWSIPRYIQLIDGDNLLYVDFESMICISVFIQIIKKREVIYLTEFPFGKNKESIVKDQQGNNYTNQFLISFHRTNPLHTPVKKIPEPLRLSKRHFIPGENWIYYKFYCGSKGGDQFLKETVFELTSSLKRNGHIDRWFFIRYHDPKSHLRIRFRAKNEKSVSAIIESVKEVSRNHIEEGVVWKIQIDTYVRELERYGHVSMDDAEYMFSFNSELVLDLLKLLEDQEESEEDHVRWVFGIKGIDVLLNLFGMDLKSKKEFMDGLAENFGKEFNAEKELRKELGEQFRKNREVIESILGDKGVSHPKYARYFQLFDLHSPLPVICNLIKLNEEAQLENDLTELKASYIHMFMNRLFNSNQRRIEMIQYHMLMFFYRSELARNKDQVTKQQYSLGKVSAL